MKALLTVLSVSAVLSTFALADSGNMGTQPNNPPMQNNQDQGVQPNSGYQFHGVRTNGDNGQDQRQNGAQSQGVNNGNGNQGQGMQSNNGYQFHGVNSNGDNRQGMRPDGNRAQGQDMRQDRHQDMRQDRREDMREERQQERREEKREDRREERRQDMQQGMGGQGQGINRQERRQEMMGNHGGGQMRRGRN